MAKPTADTDRELIQQLRNLKEGMVERIQELETRGYSVKWMTANDVVFRLIIIKTTEIKEQV